MEAVMEVSMGVQAVRKPAGEQIWLVWELRSIGGPSLVFRGPEAQCLAIGSIGALATQIDEHCECCEDDECSGVDAEGPSRIMVPEISGAEEATAWK